MAFAAVANDRRGVGSEKQEHTFSFVLPIRPARLFFVRPCFTISEDVTRCSLCVFRLVGPLVHKEDHQRIGLSKLVARTRSSRRRKSFEGYDTLGTWVILLSEIH